MCRKLAPQFLDYRSGYDKVTPVFYAYRSSPNSVFYTVPNFYSLWTQNVPVKEADYYWIIAAVNGNHCVIYFKYTNPEEYNPCVSNSPTQEMIQRFAKKPAHRYVFKTEKRICCYYR